MSRGLGNKDTGENIKFIPPGSSIAILSETRSDTCKSENTDLISLLSPGIGFESAEKQRHLLSPKSSNSTATHGLSRPMSPNEVIVGSPETLRDIIEE